MGNRPERDVTPEEHLDAVRLRNRILAQDRARLTRAANRLIAANEARSDNPTEYFAALDNLSDVVGGIIPSVPEEPKAGALRVTEYTIDVVGEGHYLRDRYDDMDLHTITVNDRQTEPHKRWGVYRTGRCLNIRTGDWEHESRPSGRDDDWFTDHRATLDDALAAAHTAAVRALHDLEQRFPAEAGN